MTAQRDVLTGIHTPDMPTPNTQPETPSAHGDPVSYQYILEQCLGIHFTLMMNVDNIHVTKIN